MPGNEFLRSLSVNELVKLRVAMKAQGLYYLEDEITAELMSRGYADVPRLCTCKEKAGDSMDCPIHHPGGK